MVNRFFARQPCCMAGTMKMFCIRKNICSHRNLLFMPCNMLPCKTSIDNSQNKVSADQYHTTISRDQVGSHRGQLTRPGIGLDRRLEPLQET